MIYEIITSDFRGKCGNCIFFNSDNGIDGECVNTENKIKPWSRFRSYNSKACVGKKVSNEDK